MCNVENNQVSQQGPSLTQEQGSTLNQESSPKTSYKLTQEQGATLTQGPSSMLSADLHNAIKDSYYTVQGHGIAYDVIHELSMHHYQLTLPKLTQLFDESWLKTHSSQHISKGGRGQTLLFTLNDPDLPHGNWCYRRYLRGGLVGKLNKSKFFKYGTQARRAHDEFMMLLRMTALGLPVPKPIAAQEKRNLLSIENAIIIEQIPHTQNLAEILAKRSLSTLELETIGKTLSRFFQYHIHHTDLNLRNILLNEQGQCFVIDFDKCNFAPLQQDFSELVNNMLQRLERSFIKAMHKGHIYNFTHEHMAILRQAALDAI